MEKGNRCQHGTNSAQILINMQLCIADDGSSLVDWTFDSWIITGVKREYQFNIPNETQTIEPNKRTDIRKSPWRIAKNKKTWTLASTILTSATDSASAMQEVLGSQTWLADSQIDDQ